MAKTISPGPVYYLCRRQHAYTIGVLLGYYDNGLGDLVRIIPYERLGDLGVIAPGTFIFTDLDRLAPAELQTAAALHKTIASQDANVLLLNDPASVPRRFDLLRRLKAAGCNDFDVHRLGDRQAIRRFPVFVRWESRHDPPLTGLLDNADALERAIAGMPKRVRTDPDLMIVEYGTAPSPDGRFRKYSAFKVGRVIYPQHCFSSHGWYIKFSEAILGDAERAENRAYVEENPHAVQLQRIFELADIDYGRIDYGLVDGRVQTFEINTNPTVMSRPPGWDGGVDYSRYAELHADALRTIMRPASSQPLRLGSGTMSADAIHAEAMRGVRQRIDRFSRSRRLRSLRQRLARALGLG
ncbi:hypothetical protein [Mesorhizobium sp. ES1-1]|uniref:hypothetical protein n=1 Tax=Mesorhizobium sp. ES1-1 TaxID=2876629 RepID=UPI001CC92494|nr:hypothetical protein [Mesorhizobium sp. ES1-1]MBZ9676396.1 hypothetical protein [Mesorhizobium sp. ES1-1]